MTLSIPLIFQIGFQYFVSFNLITKCKIQSSSGYYKLSWAGSDLLYFAVPFIPQVCEARLNVALAFRSKLCLFIHR